MLGVGDPDLQVRLGPPPPPPFSLSLSLSADCFVGLPLSHCALSRDTALLGPLFSLYGKKKTNPTYWYSIYVVGARNEPAQEDTKDDVLVKAEKLEKDGWE